MKIKPILITMLLLAILIIPEVISQEVSPYHFPGRRNPYRPWPTPGYGRWYPPVNSPVCGKVQVQCIRAPCYPVRQTFPNIWQALRSNAFDIRPGTCPGDVSIY